MSLHVITPGLQTTLQGAPRTGLRHMGMPWAGPADVLSMALANRLVGNSAIETALEITLGGFEARFEQDATIALTGAPAVATLNGKPAAFHTTLHIRSGQRLWLGSPPTGARTYLAISGGFEADKFLGSASTYLPAGLGGIDGRALQAGDSLAFEPASTPPPTLSTPPALRPHISGSAALRTCLSAESDLLSPATSDRLYEESFAISPQSNRMGLRLSGPKLEANSDGRMKSAATFPGTVQCPEDGQPIILLTDGGTTGGYPRIAHIAACDRHQLGQLRQGDSLRFIPRTFEQAIQDHKAKTELFRDWLA